MRVLILDEDARRARKTADSLRTCGEDVVAETSTSGDGLHRLEQGEWFDLVVADPPAEEEAAATIFSRMGRLNGPPPLLLVSPPRFRPSVPRWVQGVLPREPGYLTRLPEAARLTVRIHRLKIQVGHLESQLACERQASSSTRAALEDPARSLQKSLHGLLHSLHATVAQGSLGGRGSLPPALEAALEKAETAWEGSAELLAILHGNASDDASHSRSLLSAAGLIQEAFAVGLSEAEQVRVRVELQGEGKIFADRRAMADALAGLVRTALQGQEGTVLLRAWNEDGRVFFETPWRGQGLPPEALGNATRNNDGEASVHQGKARFWLPSVREEEIPGVLVGEALREAEQEDNPFTVMKIEGGGGKALDAGLITPVIKSTDRVLGTPEGGLLLLLGGLSIENTWGVAKRVRAALACENSLLAFRTLSYPCEAASTHDFLDRARGMGLLGSPESAS